MTGETQFALARFVIRHTCVCLATGALVISPGRLPLQSQTRPPTAQDTLLQKASRLRDNGSYRRAIEAFDGITFDSLNSASAFSIGSSYSALGDLENATEFLRRAVTLEPDCIEYRFQLARTLSQAGLTTSAKAQYQSLLMLDSMFIPALTSYGSLLVDEGELQEAAAIFERALLENPRDYLTAYALGSCHARLGRTDAALTWLAESISLNKHYSPALNLLASLYFNRKDYQPALLLYENLAQEHPKISEYWYRQGLCHDKLQDNTSAIDCFYRATELDSTQASYWAHLGQSYFAVGKFDSAVSAYTKSTVADPDNPVLFLNAGLCWVKIDSTEQALAAFRHSIVTSHPDKVAATYNQVGALYYNKGRYREALQAYRRAIQIDPGNLDAHFYVAFCYDQRGEYTAAQIAYRKYLALAAKDVSQQERRATVRKRISQLPPIHEGGVKK